jgi:predicted GNAT family N-acyltransferase
MISTQWFMGGEDLTDAYTVRRKVFIEEQQIPEAEEFDGTDAESVHLVVYDETETPVATGRIRVTLDEFNIGRVAVLKSHRGKQYGLFLMQVLIHACFTMGGERQVVRAQRYAQGFYEKLGFAPFGEEYEEAGIPHISMERFGDTIPLCKQRRQA